MTSDMNDDDQVFDASDAYQIIDQNINENYADRVRKALEGLSVKLPTMRLWALNELEQLQKISVIDDSFGHPDLTGSLLRDLQIADPSIRMAAVERLARIKVPDMDVLEAVTDALHDEDEFVREAAARAVQQWPPALWRRGVQRLQTQPQAGFPYRFASTFGELMNLLSDGHGESAAAATRDRLSALLVFASAGSLRSAAPNNGEDPPDHTGIRSRIRTLAKALQCPLIITVKSPGCRFRTDLSEQGAALVEWLRENPKTLKQPDV